MQANLDKCLKQCWTSMKRASHAWHFVFRPRLPSALHPVPPHASCLPPYPTPSPPSSSSFSSSLPPNTSAGIHLASSSNSPNSVSFGWWSTSSRQLVLKANSKAHRHSDPGAPGNEKAQTLWFTLFKQVNLSSRNMHSDMRHSVHGISCCTHSANASSQRPRRLGTSHPHTQAANNLWCLNNRQAAKSSEWHECWNETVRHWACFILDSLSAPWASFLDEA